MNANSTTYSCITLINRALPTGYRLRRNVRGGSYYYLTTEGDVPDVQCSIYCYALDPQDFAYAAAEINDAFTRSGLAAPIAVQ